MLGRTRLKLPRWVKFSLAFVGVFIFLWNFTFELRTRFVLYPLPIIHQQRFSVCTYSKVFLSWNLLVCVLDICSITNFDLVAYKLQINNLNLESFNKLIYFSQVVCCSPLSTIHNDVLVVYYRFSYLAFCALKFLYYIQFFAFMDPNHQFH